MMIRTLIPAALAGIIAAAIVNATTTYAPAWEGNIWPVAITHQIAYQDLGGGVMEIEGSSTKIRDCQLLSTVVYVIGDSENRTVETIHPAGPVNLRPLGATFNWGPWKVAIPDYKRNVAMRAVATHQCHPFWVTRTEFWEFDVDRVGVE